MSDYNEYLPANINPYVVPGYNLWNYYLINDYIKKTDVCRCPYAPPSSWNAYYCYGAAIYRGFEKLQNVSTKNPSYYPLLADSSSTGFTSGTTTPFWQMWGILPSSYSSPTPSGQCIFLRHGGFANVVFGGGNVESVNKTKMLSSPYSWGSGSSFSAWIVAGYGDF